MVQRFFVGQAANEPLGLHLFLFCGLPKLGGFPCGFPSKPQKKEVVPKKEDTLICHMGFLNVGFGPVWFVLEEKQEDFRVSPFGERRAGEMFEGTSELSLSLTKSLHAPFRGYRIANAEIGGPRGDPLQ